MTEHARIETARLPEAGRMGAPVRFTFDGRTYPAREGDTLASALLANGVHLMGRSFKYHRPRGALTAGPEEPNALIGVRRDPARFTPNVRATVQEVHDGLETESQNRWPTLERDVGAINDRLAPTFAAGFYYKTFMWPRAAWEKLYEPVIRRAAGLGEAPSEPDPDRYASRYAHCDVLVVGGGIAGLAAATAAAESGVRVIVCDERAYMGGAMSWDADIRIDGASGWDWAQDAAAKLAARDNVRVLTRTTAFGYYAQNMVSLVERLTDHLPNPDPEAARERTWHVRARRVVIAQGSIERHMVHGGNDRPGVMLASAARHYLHHHGVTVGRRVALYAANDAAYAAAFDLQDKGIEVPVIVDARERAGEEVTAEAGRRAIRLLPDSRVVGTGGKLRVSSISVRTGGGKEEIVPVDALLHSAGWTPSVHLHSQSRGKLRWDGERQRFLPGVTVQDNESVGGSNGADGPADAMAQGFDAGERAATGQVKGERRVHATGALDHADGVIGAGEDALASNSRAFVDFQNDVTAKDIKLAVQEGFHSIEHVKRFTTNGMATDQGKGSNMHGLAIAAELLGKPIPEVGLTTFRSPYTPITFGAIVGHAKGRLFDPERRTPIDGWSEAAGAVFEPVSQWRRARFYPRAGEDMDAAVRRECRAVREKVGLFDASTLGKIEVVGPDAAAFMNLMYTNAWTKLAPGRCRYGIMVREDGFVMDDGVVGRLAEDRFHVTTTTGGAARVLGHMEDHLQTEFTDLRVWLTSTTEQWAVLAVQGPLAREVIAPLVEGIDLTPDALPHMALAEGTICGVPTRLFRVSFTGELGFEVNVPAGYGEAVWRAIHERVEALGGCAYGTEAMHVLRAEKGFVIVGQDTDGTQTPDDAGLGWAVSKTKEDFVGIRGLRRPDLVAPGRKQLVALQTVDPRLVPEEGAQIVADPGQPIPMRMLGHVTSAYWSETLGRSIAMGVVVDGRKRAGDTLWLPMPDGDVEVRVLTSPVLYDTDGERLNG